MYGISVVFLSVLGLGTVAASFVRLIAECPGTFSKSSPNLFSPLQVWGGIRRAYAT